MLDFLLKGVGMGLDMINAGKNRDAQQEMAAQNIALQREFAQNGIRWKMADAKAAGIHPAFAMGAPISSFSPVSIGDGPSSNFASTLGSMGQDITRSMEATRTQPERVAAMKQSTLQLEGLQLDNDIKRASLASSIQRLKANANPPMPTMGTHPEAAKWEDIPKLNLGEGQFKTDKSISNTQQFTDRYGESADWWAGPYVMWRDYVANNGNPIPRDWGRMIRPGSIADRFFRTGRNFDTRFHY